MIFGKAILCVLIKMLAIGQKDHSAFSDLFAEKSSEIYVMAINAFCIRENDKACFEESCQNYLIDLEDMTDKHVSNNLSRQ